MKEEEPEDEREAFTLFPPEFFTEEVMEEIMKEIRKKAGK